MTLCTQTVARFMSPTEAYLLQSCLQAGGVNALVLDANLVQTHGLLAGAVGGVRVCVATQDEQEALQIMDALHRGEFAIDENFDGDATLNADT